NYNDGIGFIRAVKVRRTFNNMSLFPGEGGKGDGALECGNAFSAPLRQRLMRAATSPAGRGKDAPM
ncbi:hypothetical protein MR810_00145, partial [bacterium]|nr:hypothetical protein [bacterium]